MRRKLISGNWKMNGSPDSAAALAGGLVERARAAGPKLPFDMLVCPPAVLLSQVVSLCEGTPIMVGGQDCHMAASGAHTGDTSARLLKDIGCSHVILGHSERRNDHGESNAVVRAKSETAFAEGLIPIICIGETEGEREAGDALKVVETQLRESLPEGEGARAVIAYEPVWAIGTGKTATPEDVAEVHAHIRKVLGELVGVEAAEEMHVLYGGSMKPDNAADLLSTANVDGGLIGGASLKQDDFWAIAEAV